MAVSYHISANPMVALHVGMYLSSCTQLGLRRRPSREGDTDQCSFSVFLRCVARRRVTAARR